MGERYQVIVSDLAIADIDRIILNINNRSGKHAAGKAYDAIINKIKSLSTMPEAHPPYKHVHFSDQNTYRWVAAQKIHRIIYTFQEEDRVFFVRVRNVKEDPDNVALTLIEEE